MSVHQGVSRRREVFAMKNFRIAARTALPLTLLLVCFSWDLRAQTQDEDHRQIQAPSRSQSQTTTTAPSVDDSEVISRERIRSDGIDVRMNDQVRVRETQRTREARPSTAGGYDGPGYQEEFGHADLVNEFWFTKDPNHFDQPLEPMDEWTPVRDGGTEVYGPVFSMEMIRALLAFHAYDKGWYDESPEFQVRDRRTDMDQLPVREYPDDLDRDAIDRQDEMPARDDLRYQELERRRMEEYRLNRSRTDRDDR
jgi:hypothetical protein